MRAVGKDLVRRGVTQGPWASTRGVAVKLLHNHKVEFYTAHKKGDIKKENRDASINFLRLLKQMSADLVLQPHSYHLGHPGAGVPERRCGQGPPLEGRRAAPVSLPSSFCGSPRSFGSLSHLPIQVSPSVSTATSSLTPLL